MTRHSYREQDYAFGQIILTLRTALKLTQTDLANILGVSRGSVADWEAGNKYPKFENLKGLIAYAVDHHAFPVGREAEEIRALWKASQQKVLLDEGWLAALIPLPEPLVEPPLAYAAQALDQRRFGFPFQPTKFIGRGTELAEIVGLLRDPACRLLTLLGPGGIGKTRLALEVAAGHTKAYADGVAFVSLAPVSSPSQIVSAIADTLHFSFGNETDPAAHLIAYLSQRHLLLVLDNFEHVLEGAALVYDILERTLRITILITSRERLNLSAERLFDVQGLSYPPLDLSGRDTSLNPAHINIYSAVQLFIQRATQVRQDFPLTEATLKTIVHICQHVVGMPLAIELAASGVRVMSIAGIDRQISSNLDVLATTLRDVPERHRSLRAVFDQSWKLMSELEQVPFTRLAVFRGGFTVAAAEQVAGAWLPVLLALVDKSLVRHVNAPSRSSDASRFFLLEPIREYALQKLDKSEADALCRSHALYFLALAEAARAQWEIPTAQIDLEKLELENDNMRAALQWAVNGGDALLGLRLAEALVRYWRSRVDLDEARQWLEKLLALNVNETSLDALGVRMRTTYMAAMICADQRDYARAGVLFEQSRALRHALGAGGDEMTMLMNQAQQARNVGDYQRATVLFQDALAYHRATGDRGTLNSGGFGYVLYFLAHVLREQGDFNHATVLYEECIEFHGSIGDRDGKNQGLLGLSDVARDQGDVARLRQYCESALAFYREIGTQWAIGFCLNNLALAAYMENELNEAFALISESVAMFRTQKASGSIAEVLVTLGMILVARGDLDGAYDSLTESIRLAWESGPRLLIAAALEGLGYALVPRNQEQVYQGVQCLAAAEALRQQMGTPLRPANQSIYNRALSSARVTIGEDAFTDTWIQAQRLPIEQVVSEIISTK